LARICSNLCRKKMQGAREKEKKKKKFLPKTGWSCKKRQPEGGEGVCTLSPEGKGG